MILPSDIPRDLTKLDDFLAKKEASKNLKPGAEARIVWQSPKHRKKTEYALVYLHGFRASHPEGHPVHQKIADFLEANLFLSRMQEHGIKTNNALRNLTEDKLLQSARFAFTVGKRIGKKVILMGTSTGGSLALYLAARSPSRARIAGLILYSPLIRFFGMKEKFLQYKLSRAILRYIPGKSHLVKTPQTTYAEDQIWYSDYALQGALALGAFVDHYMQSSLYKQIECPVFVGFYYKNQREQDTVVSVNAIKGLITRLRSNGQRVHSANFPNAESHVICNALVSKSVQNVINETSAFLKSFGLHGTMSINST